jgi:hypothetical protein
MPATFVELGALPLTANGKLDRNALPAPSFSGEQGQRVEPSSGLEHQLHGLWAEVLGHSDFGVTDNFFRVGGHSLAAARLVSRIEQALGAAPPLSVLFQHPTIAHLAAGIPASGHGSPSLCVPESRLREQRAQSGPSLITTEPLVGDWQAGCRAFPASFAQARLWFLHQLVPELCAYHLPFLWRLSGDLDMAALRRALSDLIERHPTLRTSFQMVGDAVVQLVHLPAPFPLEVEPLAGRDGDGVIDSWLEQEATTPFDLRSGLLYEVAHRREECRHLRDEAAAELGYRGVVGPLTFISVFSYTAQLAMFESAGIGITDKQIVQVDQVLKFHKPVVAGDKLHCDVYLHEIRQAHGTDIIVTKNVVTNSDGDIVQENYTTLAGRSDESGESGFDDGTA